jgi:hypothetical protein
MSASLLGSIKLGQITRFSLKKGRGVFYCLQTMGFSWQDGQKEAPCLLEEVNIADRSGEIAPMIKPLFHSIHKYIRENRHLIPAKSLNGLPIDRVQFRRLEISER